MGGEGLAVLMKGHPLKAPVKPYNTKVIKLTRPVHNINEGTLEALEPYKKTWV